MFSWSKISVVGDLMFLVVTNTREHLLRYFALLRLTEALPLTMAESLPEISRGEQADILLRQIHAPPSAPPALANVPTLHIINNNRLDNTTQEFVDQCVISAGTPLSGFLFILRHPLLGLAFAKSRCAALAHVH